VSGPTPQQVAGVVVLYNPEVDVLDNIRSYLSQISQLFVVDNSETPDSDVVQWLVDMQGVTYHPNGGNLGVASALNTGATLALANGYRYLLTMDQDSRAAAGMVTTLLQCLSELDSNRVGIVSPVHVSKPGMSSTYDEPCRRVRYVMTSGNLLNLSAYQAVGTFMDDLFIDFVDVEYCLRLNARGYSVFQVMNAHLEHLVGDLVNVTFITSLFSVTSHSPLRMYYKTRNRFLVGNLYRTEFPAFRCQDRLRFFLEMCRLLLFEPQKIEKIRMLWRGWCDYREGKLGKYAERQS
jgi:rhamnosyltransferase